MEKIGIEITGLTFSDNREIGLKKGDVVVIVGPNNSGKSLCLREIQQKIQYANSNAMVLKSIQVDRRGSAQDLLEFFEENAFQRSRRPGVDTFSGLGYSIDKSSALMYWQKPNDLQTLIDVFCKKLSADNRLNAANPAQQIKITSQPPTHPIHFLYREASKEKLVSDAFKKAFGLELIVHKGAGQEIPLHIGIRPALKEGQDRTHEDYCEEIEKLPRIENQGDGMRSFVGIILHALLMEKDITLIDEPEAFLHPPQARLLAQMLVSHAKEDQQLFIATHSQDILHGLLSANSKRIRVIRLHRQENINNVTELNAEGIKAVWDDPLLRYSNILNGLFHEHVVLCESDSDCSFYQSIAGHIFKDDQGKRPDVLFVHCGGKQRIPQVLKALVGLKVPTTVICDFDVLREENPLHEIIKTIGGDWKNIEKFWQVIQSQVKQSRSELKTDEVKRQVNEELAAVSTTNLPSEVAEKIKMIIRKSSPWAVLKQGGVSVLPQGDASKAFRDMDSRLKSFGIFIVPVGELEGFDKTVGGHGPKWVNDVLTKDLSSSEFDQAKAFITEIYKRI